MRRSEARTGLALITPTVVIVIVVVIAPLLWSFSLAFQRIRLINLREAGIVGEYSFANIIAVINYPGFADVVFTTLAYSIFGTAGSVTLGLIAALALRKMFRGRGIVRTFMLLPYVAPMVAVAMLWRTLLSPQFGFVNHWGQALLGWDEPIGFLSDTSTALISVIVFETWRQFPFAFIFLLARIQAMPGELEEAARVDGATKWQQFTRVTLPLLKPAIMVALLFRTLDAWRVYDLFWSLADRSVDTLSVYTFKLVRISQLNLSVGNAAAVFVFLSSLLIAYMFIKLLGTRAQEV